MNSKEDGIYRQMSLLESPSRIDDQTAVTVQIHCSRSSYFGGFWSFRGLVSGLSTWFRSSQKHVLLEEEEDDDDEDNDDDDDI